MDVNVKLQNIKNIKEADITLPLNKGLYAIVGENGCGKSTLMLILSLMVKTSSAHMLKNGDISSQSSIEFYREDLRDIWKYKNGKLSTGKYTKSARGGKNRRPHSALVVSTHLEGFYEGSIFYGCRFDDFNQIDSFMNSHDFQNALVVADSFVSETLGYILHNDKSYYQSLKRIKSRDLAKQYNFNGMPYFIEYRGNLISQFKMSSGECMLLSLIDFLNNVIIKNPKRKDRLLFLIDEVELALHPSAIHRLVLFLEKLVGETAAELVIYFSTHSMELIHHISAKNIYLVENDKGKLDLINPCYPNYAIRNLYIPNGFDFVLLVEDELAKSLVDKVIRENNLAKSKLCCVLPAGGCTQMLKLHHDMITYNTLGAGKNIISIYDGDVKDEISNKSEFSTLPKCFLPIPSIEKYLKKKLLDEPDKKFIKLIGDKYFNQRSLNDIINDYNNDIRTKTKNDSSGKKFYSVLIANLLKIGVTESDFIKYLCDDIYEYEKPEKFVIALKRLLS